MSYNSPFGKSPGLADRLREFADRLGKTRAVDFVGLGPIADLQQAAALIDNPDYQGESDAFGPTTQMEYDL